jgi:hypothetical protein
LAELVEWLPTVGGLLHFVQLPAMLVARRVLDWNGELSLLAPINRQIIRVVGGGIMFCVLGLGLLVLLLHGELLHSAAGVGLCTFLSLFWAYRGAVQFFVYADLWPAGQQWAHFGSSVLFVSLTCIYAISALIGWS